MPKYVNKLVVFVLTISTKCLHRRIELQLANEGRKIDYEIFHNSHNSKENMIIIVQSYYYSIVRDIFGEKIIFSLIASSF